MMVYFTSPHCLSSMSQIIIINYFSNRKYFKSPLSVLTLKACVEKLFIVIPLEIKVKQKSFIHKTHDIMTPDLNLIATIVEQKSFIQLTHIIIYFSINHIALLKCKHVCNVTLHFST